ncbi:hypothetical protein H0H81_009641 [Sphagnurus paluster]|uniref:Uncharacterized protein n=1 Tax=Sphagnurus paluster TaxID=117069 RepID=A0A9P7FTG1_9AGAR|nr:hypothetical protein H0H81_009641 [Sphagnurus paluster]
MPEHEKRELAELQEQETRLALNAFTSSTVWDLGCTLRALAVRDYPEQAAYISITHASGTPLFLAHTSDSVSPAYAAEADAMLASVKRWQISSWRRQRLLMLGERSADYEKAEARAAEYSLKGGGWPIRVRGIVGVVAVVVVLGLYPVATENKTFGKDNLKGLNPLKYDRQIDVNHELVVKALELVLEKQQQGPVDDVGFYRNPKIGLKPPPSPTATVHSKTPSIFGL